MKKKIKKIVTILLSLFLILNIYPIVTPEDIEAAYYDSWKEITTSGNQTLSAGNYKVTSGKTINASSTQNGINISGTVNLYIANGVTLTVNGGAGSGTSGAGAGIRIPSGATLKVYGKGILNAVGGKGGTPTAGGVGNEDRSNAGGIAGAGGNGGSGAGAGIGGKGGTSGIGGKSGPAPVGGTQWDGGPGANGSDGESMSGSLYVYDTVTINASGGSGTHLGVGSTQNPSNIGHGSGGNGGAGGAGANIGGGGAGAGGGGAGCKYYVGQSGSGGSGGGSARSEVVSGGMTGNYGVTTKNGNPNNGTKGGLGVEPSPSRILISGAGGNCGTGGAKGGTVYKASTAKITALTTYDPNSGQGGAATLYNMSSVTVSQNGGSGGTSSLGTISGQPLPGIDVFPTRTGYTFNGYWSGTGAGGSGTQYIKADGTSTGNNWSSGTIYAGWTANKYTLTLAKDGVTSFSVSGATKVNDTTYTMTYGSNVTVSATAESGKTFIAWYGNDDTYSSTNNPYVFSPPAKNLTLTGTAMLGSWVEDSLEFDPSGFASETLYSTATITVKKDNTNTDLGNVTLEYGSEVINVSGSKGIYTYTGIVDSSGKAYKVCVGGEETGQTVKFSSTSGSSVTVNYYSTTIKTTLDGVNFNPGTVELENNANANDKIAVFYDEDLGYTYYYRLIDTEKTYKITINGEDSGKTVKFNQKNNVTIDYHTAQVEVKVDGQLRDMGEVSLHDNADNVVYKLSSFDNKYKIVARDTKTYRVYLNDVDMKKTVTFNATPTVINHYSVGYKLSNTDATGSVPAAQVYKEGSEIEVAGYGNITRPDHHFAGWSDGTSLYHAGSKYTVNKITNFKDVWESDSDSQAKWSHDGGTTWKFGTLEDAVIETNRTSTSLRVVIQKGGVLPNETDMTIRNNQSWEIISGVDIEVLGNSTIHNNGNFNNKGVLSGNGKLINQGQVNNETGVVTIASIDNSDGLLYGGTYGEIAGTASKKVYITGGQVKAVDNATPVILGDYSTMDKVKPFHKETVVSIMGGGTVNGTPTNDQLNYNFGGLVNYDSTKNTITQRCNLLFRNTVVIKDAILDPDDNTHDGLVTPKVYAETYEVAQGKYAANEGGVVSISYASAVNGPSTKAEMLVPQGATITLHATADTSNGFKFIGWYQGIQRDVDGNVTGFTTPITDAKTPKITINSVTADEGYYAVFEKATYSLVVQTDSATSAVVDVDSVEKAILGKSGKAVVPVEYGGSLTVTPNMVVEPDNPLTYSFLGYLKNFDDGTSEQVIQYDSVPKDPTDITNPDPEMIDVPSMKPYITAARDSFDYSLSTLSILKGWLHYDMNGGKTPTGTTDKIEDINLLTDLSLDFTLSSVVPEKQGWQFVAWERQDLGDPDRTRFDAGDTITLNGEEKDAGVLLVAIYERDKATQYFIQPDIGDEIGYTSLDKAVAATQDPTSPVYGKKDILFNAGESTDQVGEISGTLPNGYNLTSTSGAKLSVAKGKTLQIGDETTDNANNNKDGSWKTGAHVENIDFINKEGTIKFDGQHSWMNNGSFILYPSKNLQLISDLNTSNILYVELWDEENVQADILNSASWKKDSVVVSSDGDDGDTSDIDKADTSFNLMGGRVRVINDSYAVYNDRVNSTITGGYSLRVFASKDVKAMRTPLNNSALDYYDASYILEYQNIQAAIDDASRSNVGGTIAAEQNQIWIVGNSNEKVILSGDDPQREGDRFLDFLDKSYCNEVNLIAGKRNGSGTLLNVSTSSAVYEFAGDIEIQGVHGTYEAGTILNLNNFVMSGNVTVENDSYINVTNNKVWSANEVITITPKKDADGNILNKQIIAKDATDSSSHFVMHNDIFKLGYDMVYDASDTTLRVRYLGDSVEILKDLDDVRTIAGNDAIYKVQVSYPLEINGLPVTPEQQGFKYQWYEKTASGAWTQLNDTSNMNIEFDNGKATLTYTQKNVDITKHKSMYKCEVFNQRGEITGVIPVSRSAGLEVENVPTAFIQIPDSVELRKANKDSATNVEKNELDESNMISIKTFENDSVNSDGTTVGSKQTPTGIYTIKTDPSFDLSLDGVAESDKHKKYRVWAYKPDNATKLGADKKLMELQTSVKDKERFYLKMTLEKPRKPGTYRGVMNFTIDYEKP